MGGGGGGRKALAVGAALEVPDRPGLQRGAAGAAEITRGPSEIPEPKGKKKGNYIPKELTVRIIRPKDKETVSRIIKVIVEVHGGRGEIKGSVQLNGTTIGEIKKAGTLNISYDTIGDKNGTYELKAIAKDAKKEVETEPIQIIINHPVH